MKASRRAKSFPQPHGGFVKPSSFECIQLDDDKTLNPGENVSPIIAGLVVDYMTRLIMGAERKDAFRVSLRGAGRAEDIFGYKGAVEKAVNCVMGIFWHDHKSLVNACKLVTFDDWYRNPHNASKTAFDEVNPNEETTENLKIMINRSLAFFDKYGPITASGFTFEPEDVPEDGLDRTDSIQKGIYGGYTQIIDSGDGDFLTKDTLWDFKVSKNLPDSKQTLQLLIYYLMGKHSGQEKYKDISKLGIFNPRLNNVYLLDVSNITEETIRTVEKDVIGYQ